MVSKTPRKIKTNGEKTLKKLLGAPAFEAHYQELFGLRWPDLRQALLAPGDIYSLSEGYQATYYLDWASVQAATALPVQPGDKILDLCAAPGGKSLILASRLAGTGQLWASDRSPDRVRRLKKVLEDHLLPGDHQGVQVSCRDGTSWGRSHPEEFDAILLDAPCSSERHVLGSQVHLDQWSPARIRNLSVQQFALLASAFDALKPGGNLVYSTCALSPQENDEIVDKLDKKRKGGFEVISVDPPRGERTRHGIHILPDSAQGAGPIYYCLLRKKLRDNP